MRIKIVLAAAVAACALAAGPALAQSGGGSASGGGSIQNGTSSASGSGGGGAPSQPTNMYDGYKIDHGPGVIDHDTADARSHMYGTTPKAAPAASSSTVASTGSMARSGRDARGASRRGMSEGGVYGSLGATPAAYGYPAAGGYAFEPYANEGYGGRCDRRRVMINGRHWEWRRVCR